MRIACVHVPQLGLQCVTRSDPSLRGAAVAVVGAGSDVSAAHARALGSPVVRACSRAAWALGVRLGMTAASARGLIESPRASARGGESPRASARVGESPRASAPVGESPRASPPVGESPRASPQGGESSAAKELHIVATDPALERETVRAIADVMLAASPLVDVGGRVGVGGAHLAMYCELPARTRGTSFGERLLELLDGLGIVARIGIADDRFTAWVAAAHGGEHTEEHHTGIHHEGGVVSVPRGGSAAFLAPHSLALLAIAPEVQHMLEALGVRTLGEFAALPAPTVARPIDRAGGAGVDYQALARGESGHALRPYAPEASICEAVVITPALSGPAAIALVSRRIAMRLEGRGRGGRRLEVTAVGEGGEHTIAIGDGPAAPVLATASDLADALGAAGVLNEPLWRLRVVITGEVVDAAEPAVDPQRGELLSVVLGTPGSGDLFAARSSGALGSLGSLDTGPARAADRERDARRGYRRIKQRRRAIDRASGLAQTRLFRTGG